MCRKWSLRDDNSVSNSQLPDRPTMGGRHPVGRQKSGGWRMPREVRRALVITQPHLPPTELLAKNPLLLAQVIDHVQLMLVHPPGDGNQHEPERIHHSRHLVRSLSRASCLREEPARIQPDSVFGPYGVGKERNVHSLICSDMWEPYLKLIREKNAQRTCTSSTASIS